jgi:sugar lactone lactonase YvrE
MRRRAVRQCAGAVLLLGLGVGCGTPAGQIFPPLDPPMQWPPRPLEARIRYVGQLSTAADLKPARSGWQNFWGVVLGREAPLALQSPMSVSVVDGHLVYVADPGAGCVHRLDLKARTHQQFGAEAGLGNPIAVVADSQGVFVVDTDQGAVVHMDTNGEIVRTFGLGELKRPAGLCLAPQDGSILVADVGSHQVVRFARDGALMGRFGTRGEQPGQLNFPTFVCVDRQGRVLVSDSLNFRIQVFDLAGNVLRAFGTTGDRPGNLSLPKGVAIDSDGHVYVVDAHFENVQIFSPDGRILLPFGREGSSPGEFWLPAGIAIDDQDRIWVADSYNRRIQVFDYLPRRAPATQP